MGKTKYEWKVSKIQYCPFYLSIVPIWPKYTLKTILLSLTDFPFFQIHHDWIVCKPRSVKYTQWIQICSKHVDEKFERKILQLRAKRGKSCLKLYWSMNNLEHSIFWQPFRNFLFENCLPRNNVFQNQVVNFLDTFETI